MYHGIDKVVVDKDGLVEIMWKFQDVFAAFMTKSENKGNKNERNEDEAVAGKKAV